MSYPKLDALEAAIRRVPPIKGTWSMPRPHALALVATIRDLVSAGESFREVPLGNRRIVLVSRERIINLLDALDRYKETWE